MMDESEVLHRRLVALLARDPEVMAVLAAVRALCPADSAVAAGFIRNRVWDTLTGRRTVSAQDDIDVVYFDSGQTDAASDWALEARLGRLLPGRLWQVRNQARMHRRNGDAPYRSLEDALAHWLETPTAVGMRLEPDGRLTVVAPCGLNDLFALVLRPTPLGGCRRPETYLARLARKRWQQRWPEARLGLADPALE